MTYISRTEFYPRTEIMLQELSKFTHGVHTKECGLNSHRPARWPTSHPRAWAPCPRCRSTVQSLMTAIAAGHGRYGIDAPANDLHLVGRREELLGPGPAERGPRGSPVPPPPGRPRSHR